VLSVKLRLLDLAVESDVHASVLEELGRVIMRCDERIAGAPTDDFAIDMNCDLIESLLGTAYFVCQTKITSVTATAAALVGKDDHEIRRMGDRFNSEFSKVEVLWPLGITSSIATNGSFQNFLQIKRWYSTPFPSRGETRNVAHLEVISYLERMPYTRNSNIPDRSGRCARAPGLAILPACLLAGAPETVARPTSRSI
jgi:hypothetical protein